MYHVLATNVCMKILFIQIIIYSRNYNKLLNMINGFHENFLTALSEIVNI